MKGLIIVDEYYSLHYSTIYCRIGVISAASFFVLTLILLVVGGKAVTVTIGSATFGFICTFFAIYVKSWMIIVKNDSISVYLPFRKPREFHLDEISEIRQKSNRLVIYANCKKAVSVDIAASNYELFVTQLHRSGKLNSAGFGNSFVVRQYSGYISVWIAGFLLITAIFLWAIFWPDDIIGVINYFIFSVLSFTSLLKVFHYLLWYMRVHLKNEDS